jgi:hypothetical protein
MKLRDYMLNEERLDNKDTRELSKLIIEPKNTKIVLKSFSSNYDEEEREIAVKKKGKNVQFTYNMDFYEVTANLIDLCDASGYTFKTDDERNINTTTFTVVK